MNKIEVGRVALGGHLNDLCEHEFEIIEQRAHLWIACGWRIEQQASGQEQISRVLFVQRVTGGTARIGLQRCKQRDGLAEVA